MVRLLMISGLLLCLVSPAPAQQEPPPAAVAGCADLVAAGELAQALAPCRAEHAADPASPDLTRMLALAEFSEGDAERAAQLWGSLLESEGWSFEDAHDQAMALWRAGDVEAAERVIRSNLERQPSAVAHRDLIEFLMGFERWQEAAAAAAAATELFPSSCDLLEHHGVAEATLGNDERAAALLAKAIEAGCPRYRWTGRGVLPERLGQAEYRRLLDPELLADGLRELDDQVCLDQLRLLRLVMTPEQAPAVTREVLLRTNAKVRLIGLGLLADLGAAALESFKQLLADDDFILRKYTLRRIRELDDPAFRPLLEAHLEREKLPGNRALTSLALAELLLAQGDAGRAEELLLGIPEDDALHPVALVRLADHAEADGDLARALELIERARAINPQLYVEQGRQQRLREALGRSEPAD
jgi:tetratricopeptide (TPR) repeat protein